jgi:hypothetical protein
MTSACCLRNFVVPLQGLYLNYFGEPIVLVIEETFIKLQQNGLTV